MGLFGLGNQTAENDTEPRDEIERDELAGKREQRPTLLTLEKPKAAKAVRHFWDKWKETADRLQAQLKVNKLRYEGHPWAQVDPLDERRVHLPPETMEATLPPVLNRIERACDRYAAQIMADQPVMEGVPASHEDEDRDAAEATTHLLAGEFERARLLTKVKRVLLMSTVYRSSFVRVDWDPEEGGMVAAQKFLPKQDNQGAERQVLTYIRRENGQDIEVKTADEATQIWQGNTVFHVGSPMNVRFRGGLYAHSAKEAAWGELVPLRDVFDAYPDLRNKNVGRLLAAVPPDAEEFLEDLRGTAELHTRDLELSESDMEMAGDDLYGERDDLLDHPAFVLRYWHKKSRQYTAGADITLVGKVIADRRELRWGLIPLAQFKCLPSLTDRMGRALVDVVKDAQTLLDFVNASILQLLRVTARKRYFLQYGTMVNQQELESQSGAVIYYNGQNPPTPEQPGEVPNTVIEFVDRYRQDFDDMTGIHETAQGRHVPGVTSGRHAEALRSGDETMLGLTRAEVEEGLTALSRIMVAAIKKEWGAPRRVRYLRSDRAYIEKHFAGADIGGTTDVILKKGTLLMMTPQQKTETIYGLAQMGFLGPEDLRRLLPLVDVAGLSLSEDAHYIRARRMVERFLEGPPEALMQLFQQFEQASAGLDAAVAEADQILPQVPAQMIPLIEEREVMLAAQLQELEMQWMMELQKYSPVQDVIDADPMIAGVVYTECAAAVANEKVETLPVWWVEPFKMFTQMEGIMAGRIPPPAPPPGMEGGSSEGRPEEESGGPPGEVADQSQEIAPLPPGANMGEKVFGLAEGGTAP
jgi:hypothetical protein